MRPSPTLTRLGAAGLVLCPLLYAVSRFTWPAGSDGSTARQVAAAAAHPAAWNASGILEGLSGLAALLGALCVALVVGGRGRVLARIALGLAACSAIGFVANWTINSVLAAQASRIPLGQATSAYSAVLHSAYVAPFIVFLVVAPLWTLFLVIASARHGLVAWWVVALLVVGAVGGAVLSKATPVAAVPLLVQAVAMALVARGLVGLSSTREPAPVVAQPLPGVSSAHPVG